MKICRVMLVLLVFVVSLFSGCRTAFKNPLRPAIKASEESPGATVFQYTRQASIPSSQTYRPIWPKWVEVTASPGETNSSAKVFDPAIIGTVVGAMVDVSTGVSEDYWNTASSTYYYREDILIIGTNVSEGIIKTLMEYGAQPRLDAQRSPWFEK